jgi:hypothetical protein
MGTLQDMVVKPWNVSMDDGDAPSLFDITYAPMHKDKWKESLWRGRPLTELSRDELMDAWVELAQMCLPH